MQEDLHTAQWIVAKLEGDTGVGGLMEPGNEMISGAFYGVIPSDVDLPAVRFHVQNPHDVRGAARPAHRIMVLLDWLIAAVVRGRGLAALVPIADRLDEVLQESTGETSTIRVMSCVRLEPFSLPEEEDTALGYRHAGGIYRTLVQKK